LGSGVRKRGISSNGYVHNTKSDPNPSPTPDPKLILSPHPITTPTLNPDLKLTLNCVLTLTQI